MTAAALSPTQYLPPVQTIAVTGGKGGIGKSSVAINLAMGLGALGRRVLLLDGDLALGNVHTLLNMKPEFNLAHVMRGEQTLGDVLLEGPGGITVVPSANGVMDLANLGRQEHASLISLFSELALDIDTMILDVAPGLSESVLSFSQAAREIMVVLCDEPSAIEDAISMIRVLKDTCGVQRFRIVANQTESSRHGLDLYSTLSQHADRHLDVVLDFCGSIPFDKQMKLAVSQQRAVMDAYPRCASGLAFRKLAARVDRWPRPQTPGGQVEFFVERLIQAAIGTR